MEDPRETVCILARLAEMLAAFEDLLEPDLVPADIGPAYLRFMVGHFTSDVGSALTYPRIRRRHIVAFESMALSTDSCTSTTRSAPSQSCNSIPSRQPDAKSFYCSFATGSDADITSSPLSPQSPAKARLSSSTVLFSPPTTAAAISWPDNDLVCLLAQSSRPTRGTRRGGYCDR